jgi:hypothetical protein
VAVIPVVPDDAPYPVREGIARRRLVALHGECPCGATLSSQSLRQGAQAVEVEHDGRCPAVTAKLRKAIRRWSR